MHEMENMPLQPSSIYSCPWQMRQSAFFPVKPSVYLYSDRKKLRACQKLWNGPGVGKWPAPGQCKISQMPTPRDWQGGQMPRRSLGGGGGWAQLELTDA